MNTQRAQNIANNIYNDIYNDVHGVDSEGEHYMGQVIAIQTWLHESQVSVDNMELEELCREWLKFEAAHYDPLWEGLRSLDGLSRRVRELPAE